MAAGMVTDMAAGMAADMVADMAADAIADDRVARSGRAGAASWVRLTQARASV